MIRRIILIVLAIVVAAVVANDVWRYATAARMLTSVTYDLSRSASELSGDFDRAQVGSRLVAQATPSGVRVYQYDQDERLVRVWTETDVAGTWVAGPVYNMMLGMPFADALGEPLVIRDYGEAMTQ